LSLSAARALLASLAFVSLLALAGCRTPGGPAGEDWRAAPQDRARVEEWLATAREEMGGRRSIRAFVKLRIDSEQGKGTVRAVIVAERPDRLRLETLNMLGQTQTLLAVDGKSFAFYDGRGPVEQGTTEPQVLRERLGLDVEPLEAVALLLAAPVLPAQPPRRISALRVWGAPVPSEERRAEFDAGSVRFAGAGELREVASIDPGGRLRWQAQFEGWRDVPGGRYPSELRISFPETGLRAELSVEEVELNAALDAQLFRLPGRTR
jgi:outer membrane biogenesis lipoprotein LolB